MKLSSLRLQNFRCFEDTTIHFHEQLTVLVGGNGSGKTTVLDGTGALLAQLCMTLGKVEALQRLPIKADEANHGHLKGPCSLSLSVKDICQYTIEFARGMEGTLEPTFKVIECICETKPNLADAGYAAFDSFAMYYNTSRKKQLVYDDGDKWDTACAKQLLQQMEAHYGKNDPKMDELALHIETRQWERENETNL